MIVSLVTLTLAATAIAVVAVSSARTASRNAEIAARNAAEAARQNAIALSRQLATESASASQEGQPWTARQLAVAAWSVSPTSQAQTALMTLLVQQQREGTLFVANSSVFGVAFSPDGRLLATADGDGTARLWNPATGRPIGNPIPADTGPQGSVNAVAFSPDGRLLATADSDGTVWLWRMSLFTNPCGALSADVGLPTRHDWRADAPGEAFPRACA